MTESEKYFSKILNIHLANQNNPTILSWLFSTGHISILKSCTFSWLKWFYPFINSPGVHTHNKIENSSCSCQLIYHTQFCRIKGCDGAGWPPPPIIFERLKLPQQIIYRRKENLSESPNHQKYWENILVSRFYEQFSRNRRNLGHFRKFEKISNS